METTLNKQDLSDIMVCIETDIKRLKTLDRSFVTAKDIDILVSRRLSLIKKVYNAAKQAAC